MKRTLIGLTALLFLASCTTYQFYSLKSSLSQLDYNEFVFENDSVAVSYDFRGEGGYIFIEIVNKLNQPLVVDWESSSMIIDGESFAYWNDIAAIDLTNYQVMADGTISKSSKESFIPPNSKVSNRLMKIVPSPVDIPSSHAYEKVTYQGVAAKRYEFDQGNSPIAFRSYLTFKSTKSSETFAHDHTFWVAEINSSFQKPVPNAMPTYGLYTAQSDGSGGGVLGFLVIAGIVWVVVANR